jgi:hypothetical protein
VRPRVPRSDSTTAPPTFDRRAWLRAPSNRRTRRRATACTAPRNDACAGLRAAVLAVLVGIAAPTVLAGVAPPAFEALQTRLKKGGPPDAELVQLGRQAISEARAAGDAEAWRDALLITARNEMAIEDFDSGMRLLENQPWPPSPAAQAVLHLLAADALIDRVRRPDANQGSRTLRDFRRELDELRRARLVFDRLSRAERHLDAAWAVRGSLPDDPGQAFGSQAYTSPSPPTADARTSRDFFTLFIARLLAKREAWRAVDARAQVPAELLIDPPEVCPGDASVHPLVRSVAVLRDLERWHLQAGRRAAALRTVTEAMSILGGASWSGEKAALADAFEQRIRCDHDLPEFSAALAALVPLVRGDGYQRRAVYARIQALALEGKKAFPTSAGATACDAILAAFGPALELTGMAEDGPAKPSLRLRTRGLPEVHLSAFRLDHAASAELLLSGLPLSADTLQEVAVSGSPVATWTVRPALPDDLETHTTWITPPLTQPGGYVIAASSETDLRSREAFVAATTLVVTHLVLVTRNRGQGGVEVTVVSGDTGRPVAGVTVSCADPAGGRAFAAAETDSEGRALLPSLEEHQACAIVARRGEDFAIGRRPSVVPRPLPERAMLITDRHRYRPGEKVRFLYLAARDRGANALPVALAGGVVAVTLADGAGRELRRLRPITDAFGVATGALTIPTDRPPGVWTLAAEGPAEADAEIEVVNDGGVRIHLEQPVTPVRAGETFSVSGRVTGPDAVLVSSPRVLWSLSADGAVTAAGDTIPGDGGAFALSLTAPRLQLERSLVVDAYVESGELLTGASVEVPFVFPLRLYINSGTLWLRQGQRLRVAATRARGDQGAPGESRLRIIRLQVGATALLPGDELLPPAPGRTEDDRREARFGKFAPMPIWSRTYARGEVCAASGLTHGADGVASAVVNDLAPGLYEVEVETDGDRCEPLRATDRVIVLERDGTVPFGAPLLLVPAETSVACTSPWQLLEHCGLPDQTCFVERYLNGRLVERGTRERTSIESFQSARNDAGDHDLRMWLVSDYRLVSHDSSWVVSDDGERLGMAVERRASGVVYVTTHSPAGSRLSADSLTVFALFSPPEDQLPTRFADTPEPFILSPGRVSLGEINSSLGERPAVMLNSPRPSTGQGSQPAYGGYLRGLLGWGVKDPGAVREQGGKELSGAWSSVPAPGGEAALPEPLTFQTGLAPTRDGVIRIQLPAQPPSGTLWVVAISRDMRYGFLEVPLGGK